MTTAPHQPSIAPSRDAVGIGSDALVRAQCLTALMSHPEIREWVKTESVRPGKGGALRLWTDLAREYAEALSCPNGADQPRPRE